MVLKGRIDQIRRLSMFHIVTDDPEVRVEIRLLGVVYIFARARLKWLIQ